MENKENNDNKEIPKDKEKEEIKSNDENKENNEQKEKIDEIQEKKDERISKENKDLLLKIINNTIKKGLEALEKRNKEENSTIILIKNNVVKIKSI